MRLAASQVDKRISIKLDKSIRTDETKGIMSFGKNNDYPQVIESLINGSKTAKSVAKIYSKFLSGSGFENEDLNNIVVGKDVKGKPITMLSLLRQISNQISYHNGVYIHANENLEGQVVNVRIVPFKYCRFNQIDDTGYTSKIAVYNNWEKGKDSKFDKNKIVTYPIFNLTPEVFQKQVSDSGVDKFGKEGGFRGQIYFHFMDESYLYPLSPFDVVYLDCDTEQQVSLYKNNQVRNGMTKKSVMRMVEPTDENDKEDLEKEVTKFTGPDGPSTLILYDDVDPQTNEIKKSGSFAIDSIDSNIQADTFQNWTKELANDIRKSINALPAVLIDYEESKLGNTSGEAVKEAVNFYNAVTQDDRASISQIFADIFKYSSNQDLKNNTNWNILPLRLHIEDAKDDPIDIKLKSQAELRGSVGGVTALITLQQSIAAGTTTKEAGIAIIKEIYGISDEIASEMVGNPKILPNGTTP